MSTESPDKRKKKTLYRADAIRVSRWIMENWQRIGREKPTYEHLAAEASKHFAIECGTGSMKGLISDLGLAWHTPVKHSGKGPSNDRVRFLGSCLVELFERLGEQPPDRLKRLVRGESISQQALTGMEAEANGSHHG